MSFRRSASERCSAAAAIPLGTDLLGLDIYPTSSSSISPWPGDELGSEAIDQKQRILVRKNRLLQTLVVSIYLVTWVANGEMLQGYLLD